MKMCRQAVIGFGRHFLWPLVGLFGLLSGPGNAYVIDFETLGSVPYVDVGTSVLYAGEFKLSFTGGGVIGTTPDCSPSCVTNGTQVFYGFNFAQLTITRPGGDFTLRSVDAAQPFSGTSRVLDLVVTATDDSSTFSEHLTAPLGWAVFSTYPLETFARLSTLTFSGAGLYPEFAIDNIVVTYEAPLPAAIWLFGGALAATGFAARRRRCRIPKCLWSVGEFSTPLGDRV
jgi:hypothetical protein